MCGLGLEQQFVDGLSTIADELRRLSEQLARGDLDALAIEGKFLEQRYGNPTEV